MDMDAVTGEDYKGWDNITISFAPEQTSVTEVIDIIDDQRMEGDELFQIVLHRFPHASDNVDICSNNATVLIRDGDGTYVSEEVTRPVRHALRKLYTIYTNFKFDPCINFE